MHPKFDRDPMAKAECARQPRLTVAGRAAREAVRRKAQRLHIFCNSAIQIALAGRAANMVKWSKNPDLNRSSESSCS